MNMSEERNVHLARLAEMNPCNMPDDFEKEVNRIIDLNERPDLDPRSLELLKASKVLRFVVDYIGTKRGEY